MTSISEPFFIGDVEISNRLVLAPLAGIGNWFVRLQAKRYGAGLVTSEMISSFGLHYGDRKTLEQFLCIHPDEHPVSIQLFGQDADVMGHAAEIVAAAGADIIDINMGCPVRKVCKTGAGASLLDDPDRAVAIAQAAVNSSGGLPVTVKVRSGQYPGSREGFDLAKRLVVEAGASAIGFHPRHASQQHKGAPDYALAAELVGELDVPVVISGGLSSTDGVREVLDRTGAAAVMIARGSLGNPWIFAELLGSHSGQPSTDEVMEELLWVIDAAEQHLGEGRAGHYLRKFYPWYSERAQLDRAAHTILVSASTTRVAREAIAAIRAPALVAA